MDDLPVEYAGEWQQTEDGPYTMEITKNPEKGFDVMVYNGTGRDGIISAYRMKVRYDAMKEVLVYTNGTKLELAVTDGSQEETEDGFINKCLCSERIKDKNAG